MKKKKEEPAIVEDHYLELDNENAVCSICLAEYEDGDQLRQLGCKHHYHVSCIDEWLRLNAKCPLCIQALKLSPAT